MFRKLSAATPIVAMLCGALFAASAAEAQCCGSTGYAYTAGYQPTTAYQPVTTQTYRTYSGWYPGYWLRRLFRPRTYTTSYTAAYTPTYNAGYQTANYHQASYAPSCQTCYSNPCCCSSQNVVMRPVSYSDPCSCASGGTTQAVYESGSNCPSCASPATYDSPSDSRPQAPSTFQGYDDSPQPTLAPSDEAPTQRSLRPESPTTHPDDSSDSEGGSVGTPSSYFQAPKLFDPQDNVTDRRASVPIWTAVYHKPVGHKPRLQNTSHTTIDRAQAERDAQGWSAAD